MPAQNRWASTGSANYGISWSDVGQAILEHETDYHCRLQVSLTYQLVSRKSTYYQWVVGVVAHSSVQVEKPLIGLGEMAVGGNRGAASMSGAVLSALMSACEDLRKRRETPRKHVEVARLPGFD